MADEATQDAVDEAVEQENVADESTVDDAQEEPGAEALGDPGKKALNAMKESRNEARAALREAQAELARLKAAAEGREAEHKAEQDAQKVRDEALAAANKRVLRAEVKSQAAGKLADPMDALRFLDLDEFEADDNGDFDTDEIASKIAGLLADKPYLAVAQSTRFQGTADQGARKADAKSEEQQLEESLKTASPAQRIAIRQRLAAIKAEAANR